VDDGTERDGGRDRGDREAAAERPGGQDHHRVDEADRDADVEPGAAGHRGVQHVERADAEVREPGRLEGRGDPAGEHDEPHRPGRHDAERATPSPVPGRPWVSGPVLDAGMVGGARGPPSHLRPGLPSYPSGVRGRLTPRRPPMEHTGHAGHRTDTPPEEHGHAAPVDHGHDDHGHGDHGHDHSAHAEVFRRRFWWSLLLTIPVVLTSEMVMDWFGYSLDFPGRSWVGP